MPRYTEMSFFLSLSLTISFYFLLSLFFFFIFLCRATAKKVSPLELDKEKGEKKRFTVVSGSTKNETQEDGSTRKARWNFGKGKHKRAHVASAVPRLGPTALVDPLTAHLPPLIVHTKLLPLCLLEDSLRLVSSTFYSSLFPFLFILLLLFLIFFISSPCPLFWGPLVSRIASFSSFPTCEFALNWNFATPIYSSRFHLFYFFIVRITILQLVKRWMQMSVYYTSMMQMVRGEWSPWTLTLTIFFLTK